MFFSHIVTLLISCTSLYFLLVLIEEINFWYQSKDHKNVYDKIVFIRKHPVLVLFSYIRYCRYRLCRYRGDYDMSEVLLKMSEAESNHSIFVEPNTILIYHRRKTDQIKFEMKFSGLLLPIDRRGDHK